MRVKKVAKVVDKSTKKKVNNKDGMLDMVIAFDTTGSMSAYIGNVKEHVVGLIPKLFSSNPNLRLGIVAFGDYCDMQSTLVYGKAYQCLGLTNDENKIIEFINNVKNTNGGDGDEFYELVIKKITEETDWRKDSEKSVLLIGDANPHKSLYIYSNEQYQIDWRKEAKKASEKGIKFDTLRIHEEVVWYKELSKMTNGVSLPFGNSKKMADVVYSSTLARGGETTKSAFVEMSMTMADDAEMSAVYDAYAKSVVK